MNQTQGPSETDEQSQSSGSGGAGTQPGLDRPHLRTYEQLRRSVTDRKVAGVAGGLGRHLNVDPTVLRVLFVVLCFFGGAGFVLYGVAWLLVPEDGRTEGALSMSDSTRNGVLIVTGVVAALLVVGDSWGGIGFPWPLVVIGLGALVYLAFRERGPRPGSGMGTTSTGSSMATSTASFAGSTPPETASPEIASPESAFADQPPGPPWIPSPASYQPPLPPYQPPPRKTGPRLFGLTLALVAVALGVLGLVDVSGGGVADAAYPALALTVVGVMLVVGAFVGRAGGLILLGIVAALALTVTSLVGSFGNLDVRDGQRIDVSPTTAATVRDSYRMTSGRVSVDLSSIADPQALGGRTLDIGGRAGEVVLVLPSGIESDVTASVDGPGQIDLPDRSSGGINTDLAGVYGDEDPDSTGRGVLTIHTHLSAGHIDVRTN